MCWSLIPLRDGKRLDESTCIRLSSSDEDDDPIIIGRKELLQGTWRACHGCWDKACPQCVPTSAWATVFVSRFMLRCCDHDEYLEIGGINARRLVRINHEPVGVMSIRNPAKEEEEWTPVTRLPIQENMILSLVHDENPDAVLEFRVVKTMPESDDAASCRQDEEEESVCHTQNATQQTNGNDASRVEELDKDSAKERTNDLLPPSASVSLVATDVDTRMDNTMLSSSNTRKRPRSLMNRPETPVFGDCGTARMKLEGSTRDNNIEEDYIENNRRNARMSDATLELCGDDQGDLQDSTAPPSGCNDDNDKALEMHDGTAMKDVAKELDHRAAASRASKRENLTARNRDEDVRSEVMSDGSRKDNDPTQAILSDATMELNRWTVQEESNDSTTKARLPAACNADAEQAAAESDDRTDSRMEDVATHETSQYSMNDQLSDSNHDEEFMLQNTQDLLNHLDRDIAAHEARWKEKGDRDSDEETGKGMETQNRAVLSNKPKDTMSSGCTAGASSSHHATAVSLDEIPNLQSNGVISMNADSSGNNVLAQNASVHHEEPEQPRKGLTVELRSDDSDVENDAPSDAAKNDTSPDQFKVLFVKRGRSMTGRMIDRLKKLASEKGALVVESLEEYPTHLILDANVSAETVASELDFRNAKKLDKALEEVNWIEFCGC